MESQLADGLDVEDDDLITDTPPSLPQPLGPCQGQSQPSARVFVEKNSERQAGRRHSCGARLLTVIFGVQSVSSPQTVRPGGRPASR